MKKVVNRIVFEKFKENLLIFEVGFLEIFFVMMLRELGLVIEKIDNKELIGRVLEIL